MDRFEALTHLDRHDGNVTHRAGPYIIARGAVELPACACAQCGSTERGGMMVERRLFAYRSTLILGILLLVGPVMAALVGVFTRNSIEARYYLCPRCLEQFRAHHQLDMALTGSGIFTLGAGILTGSVALSLMAPVLFMVALVSVMLRARRPLKVLAQRDGVFTLEGPPRAYLDAMDEHQDDAPRLLPPAPTS